MDGEQGIQGVHGIQGIQGIHGDHGTLVTRAECNILHAASDVKYEKLYKLTEDINNRLYRDNGHLSIQTRLDRGDRILGVLCWVTSIAGSAIIVAAVAFVWRVIIHVGT
jgi:hypothetical protein